MTVLLRAFTDADRSWEQTDCRYSASYKIIARPATAWPDIPMTNRSAALARVTSALSGGRADLAMRECQGLLAADAGDVEASHLYGRSLAALGRRAEAEASFRRALALKPAFVPALVDLGLIRALYADYRGARELLERARAIDAAPAELHFGIGVCDLEAGDLPAAERNFRQAIARRARFTEAHNNLGVVLDRLGRLPRAVECFRRAVALRANFADAQRNLGDALLRLGEANEALQAFAAVVAMQPDNAGAYADLGRAQLTVLDFAAAAVSLERALSLDGKLADCAANLGEARLNLRQPELARIAYQQALSVDRGLAEAHLGLARAAAMRGDRVEALRESRAACELKPGDKRIVLRSAETLQAIGYADTAASVLQQAMVAVSGDADLHDALGDLLAEAGQIEAAREHYERASRLDPKRAHTHLKLGRALETLGSAEEALAPIRRALSLTPGDGAALAALASCAFRVCEWDAARDAVARLRAMTDGIELLPPFLLFSTDLEPGVQADAARRHGTRVLAGASVSTHVPRHGAQRPLRVAYVSPDFREHAVGCSIVGVIEHHDRDRVRPLAVSLARPDASQMGARLRSAFDEFIEAASLSDDDLAEELRAREVDVAVDLAGYTRGARPALFARRVAPLQINYLGYPGSMGCAFMDCIVGDATVIPATDEHLFTERVLRMPHCYLPFDGTRTAGGDCNRAAVGLPDEGLVFCAFNTPFKITREVFTAWMSLLREVPGSVLWLRAARTGTVDRLRAAAAALKIDAERLIFAPHMPQKSAHLARCRLADLFLDTAPYNAHSTAVEMLSAGLPILTCRGRTFAARVGASALAACGLGELVCADLEAYHARALELARSPERLLGIRTRLEQCRSSAPLFDTRRYTGDFENLLASAYHNTME
jgi:protein O-GlcNAc transferase